MATEGYQPWLDEQYALCGRVMRKFSADPESQEYCLARDTYDLVNDASCHFCVATLYKLADGRRTVLPERVYGKYAPMLDNLRMLRLMQ